MTASPELVRVAEACAGRAPADAATVVAARVLLMRGDPLHSNFALGALGKAGAAGAAGLAEALAPGRPAAVRNLAAYTLAQIGGAAEGAIGALAAAASETDKAVAGAAMFALGRIGPAAVAALLPLLGHRDTDVVVQAARALGEIGDKALDGVKIERRADAPPAVQIAFAELSVRVFGEAKRDLPLIVGALDSPDAPVRAAAVGALQGIGARAGLAAPRLAKVVTADPDAAVRAAAAVALLRLTDQPSRVVPALTAAAADPAEALRRAAVMALAHLGPKAVAALPAVQALANDPSADLRAMARAAAERMAGPA
jgi:HEAT repeat protein